LELEATKLIYTYQIATKTLRRITNNKWLQVPKFEVLRCVIDFLNESTKPTK